MMRRNAWLTGLLLVLAGLTGCKQKYYLSECDVQHYHRDLGLPRNLENDPHASIIPDARTTPPPTTVNDPDRPIRYITLAESIAIALEQGNIGSQSALFPGIANDNLVQFNGRFVGADDSIRVLALDPAISGADIEGALAKFDARWITSTSWQKRDDNPGNILLNFQNGDNATVSSALVKPLPTGGTAGITWSTDYNLLTAPPTNSVFTNPSYRPRLQFQFEQPLLQGFGVEINQLAISHPGTTAIPGVRASGGGRVEGVLITRLRYEQSKMEFERNVNYMLLNVEYAYWNLYASYYVLFSREQGLRQAFDSFRLTKARVDAGSAPQQDLEQVRAQYEQFRAQRVAALGDVLDRERQLRGLLGLPIEDGQRLVPSDSPVLAAFTPDWSGAVNDMMMYRPELTLARQDLKFRQLDLILQKNFLKPDLRFTASYDINGLGTRLDGGPISGTSFDGNTGQTVDIPGNALANLTDNQFNSWSLGLRLDVPLGTRDAHASVRVARLNLTRSFMQLKDQELKAERFLALQYRTIFQKYAEIEANRAQREANARQLELRFQEFIAGRGTLDILLEAQRNFADALASEFRAISEYNQSLCGFQFAKGTVMQYMNVQVADGPLPECAQVRAVEHARQRNLALSLRERPAVAVPGGRLNLNGQLPSLPDLQASQMALPTATPQLAPPAEKSTTPAPAATSAAAKPIISSGAPAVFQAPVLPVAAPPK